MKPRGGVRWAGVAAIALALVGCGSQAEVVRPFVKRGSDAASDKSPADKTAAVKAAGPGGTAQPAKTSGP